MGDLVVGARSGSGEPEKEEAEVPPVDNADSDGSVPGPGAPGAQAGYGAAAGYGAQAGYGARAAGYTADGAYERHGAGYDGEDGDHSGHGGRHDGLSGRHDGLGRQEGDDELGGISGRPPEDGDDAAETPEDARPSSGGKQRSFWKELPLLIGIALVLALLIKTFLVQAFSIPSGSMEQTLKIGDRVLVDKLTPWFGSEPTRGEVVVFHDPGGWLPENPPPSSNVLVRNLQKSLSFIGLMPSADEKDLIKRVIGVGGDTVECNGTGPVMVNGKPLNEPYIYPGNTPCSPDKPFKITVPKGRIWVMGDHRQDSLDSRFHQELPGHGTIADSQVVGRAIVVAWPVTRWDWLGIPSTFSQPGIDAAGSAVPAAAGFAGALPLVLVRRRRLRRKAAGAAGGDAAAEQG